MFVLIYALNMNLLSSKRALACMDCLLSSLLLLELYIYLSASTRMQCFSSVRQCDAILSGVGLREEFCWAEGGREELANIK